MYHLTGRKNRKFLIALVVVTVLLVGSMLENANHHGVLKINYEENHISHEKTVVPKPQPVPLHPKEQMERNPIPPESDLRVMTPLQIGDFFYSYIVSPQAICSRVIRMGRVGDGGWELCDDPRYKPDIKDCLVYSIGINNEWSFDDAMEKYGCEVHSYDPSMTKVTDHVRGQKIHFHKVGISGEDTTVDKNGTKWDLYTLGSLRRRNGHENIKRRVDMVKMDVESAEYEALAAAIKEGSLLDVRQLAFEIHLTLANDGPHKVRIIWLLNIFRGLWDQGFRIYFTTRNTVKGNILSSKVEEKQRSKCIELNLINIKHRR